MATFTISISGSSVINGSKSWAIQDADVQKLSDYLVATRKGEMGAELTPQQAFVMWVQEFVTRTKNDVQNFNRAITPITPIDFT